jgi:hypothetical protein
MKIFQAMPDSEANWSNCNQYMIIINFKMLQGHNPMLTEVARWIEDDNPLIWSGT